MKQAMSKTQKALDLVDGGMTPYAAAVKVKLAPNAVYSALKKRREVIVCPCCGNNTERLLVPDNVVKQLWDIRKKQG